jgi:hypothetical protein
VKKRSFQILKFLLFRNFILLFNQFVFWLFQTHRATEEAKKVEKAAELERHICTYFFMFEL